MYWTEIVLTFKIMFECKTASSIILEEFQAWNGTLELECPKFETVQISYVLHAPRPELF